MHHSFLVFSFFFSTRFIDFFSISISSLTLTPDALSSTVLHLSLVSISNAFSGSVSTKPNKIKKSTPVTPIVNESKPVTVQQQHQQQSNLYTILQQVQNFDGSLTVIPINTLNLPQVDVCQYKSQLQVDNTNRLDGSPIILHTDSADSMNTANQLHALTQVNPTILDFNMNEYLWNHQTQHQDGNGGNSSILITNNNHYDLLVDDVGDVEDEQSKEDNIIELACINKKLKREFNDTTNNTSGGDGAGGSSNCCNSNNNNDYNNELQLIKHKRYRLCNTMMKSIDQINDDKK